ncbi:hypothetical protein, partial [Salmonella enterica]|uniref:hypothetical protein n=1 Tax=Salmonella enterica TaxID=28901 RepID=UPI001BAE72F4
MEELCEDLIMLKKGKAVLQGNLSDIKRFYGVKNVIIHSDNDVRFLESIQGVIGLETTKDGVI